MKKFKYLALLLLSALCIFAAFTFGGCKEQTGYYVENSLTYKFDNSYYSFYAVSGQFKVYIPEKGSYKVEYTLTTYGSDGTQSRSVTSNLTTTNGGKQTISFDLTFDKMNYKNNSTAQLSGVTITKNENEGDNNYSSYAIGFGVTAGVLLIGAVVVFVLDKKGLLQKHN